MNICIRLLPKDMAAPLELLLLADPSAEIINEYLGRGQCYIAAETDAVADHNEIIGVYVLIRTRPETIEIVNLAVREDCQGRGIGKMLVLDAVRKAREQGAKTVEIGTGNSSLAQLGLYQKCGFRITGVDRDFFTKHYKEEIFENGIQCRDMIRLSLE